MRILVADDEEISRIKLERLTASWGYEVISARDGDEAWGVLKRDDAPLLAVLDWIMPGVDGAELCRRVREARCTPYTYVIMLTGRTDPKDIIQGMDAGADDYVKKPFDPQELKVRLRAGRRIVELQEALRLQATHDSLTGAWNRGAIIEMLDRELARTKREGTTLGLVMADLDHFKQVNDVHGHQAGDAALTAAVQRMTRVMRRYDYLGRYGGEEFLVLLPRCDLAEAAGIAERLRCAVADGPVATPAGPIALTVSLGVATSDDAGRVTSEALLQRADAALYEAKRLGRNQVAVAAGRH